MSAARRREHWWRRIWYWPRQPPSRRHPAYATVEVIRPRPVPLPIRDRAEDDKTRCDLSRVRPFLEHPRPRIPRRRGAHRGEQ